MSCCFCMITVPMAVLSQPREHWMIGDRFSMMFYCEDSGLRLIACTFSVVGALFGVVHCLAWNFSYSTMEEQLYWRAASSILVGCCVAVLRAISRVEPLPAAYPPGFWKRVMLVVGDFLFLGAAFSYPIARITLLVITIASLHSLPPSAFDTVDWIDFVPHI